MTTALLSSVGDCTACPATEGCLRKYLSNFTKNILPIVRPLWQADWWEPSANNPTAYSFLPQLSALRTDGISLSWRGLRARSSLQWYRTATARLLVTWPRSAATIGRPWRGTGCCSAAASGPLLSSPLLSSPVVPPVLPGGAASVSGPACCLLGYVTALPLPLGLGLHSKYGASSLY